MLPTKFQVSWPFRSGEAVKNRFSSSGHSRHFGCQIGINFSKCFNLQVILLLLTKFQVSWLFSSGEEAKIRFSRWLPWWLGLPIGIIVAIFIYKASQCFLLSPTKSVGLSVKKKRKIGFSIWRPYLGFPIRTISSIFVLQVTLMIPT